ncbi:hypothetical protein [Saccharothrix sp. Mg75]|uniref:hypothetical protein n=1 Tax=Saccharothrix sp. Mg75 TaxID=3445357 RepID=UPI003EEBA5D3
MPLEATGRRDDALAHLDLALDVRREIEDRWGEAETPIKRGDVLVGDDQSAARTSWPAALAVLDEFGGPGVDDVRGRLNSVPPPRSAPTGAEVTPAASTP